MQRMGRVIGLNAKDIAEYKRLHAAVWPEILALPSAMGMRDSSIFLKEPVNLLLPIWNIRAATSTRTTC